jgi:hypothetical protein
MSLLVMPGVFSVRSCRSMCCLLKVAGCFQGVCARCDVLAFSGWRDAGPMQSFNTTWP